MTSPLRMAASLPKNRLVSDELNPGVEIPRYDTQPVRFAILDIESYGLTANPPRFLCACYKFTDEDRIITIRGHRMADIQRAIQGVRDIWDMAHVVVTWNGKRFDTKMLNAWATKFGVKKFEEKMHEDVMYEYAKLRTGSNTLNSAAAYLDLPSQKYYVPLHTWAWAADTGHPESKKSFEEIVTHCQWDVLTEEAALRVLAPYIVRITR